MLAQCHQWVFDERRGNPNTTGQASAGPKTVLYTGTAKLTIHVYLYLYYQPSNAIPMAFSLHAAVSSTVQDYLYTCMYVSVSVFWLLANSSRISL